MSTRPAPTLRCPQLKASSSQSSSKAVPSHPSRNRGWRSRESHGPRMGKGPFQDMEAAHTNHRIDPALLEQARHHRSSFGNECDVVQTVRHGLEPADGASAAFLAQQAISSITARHWLRFRRHCGSSKTRRSNGIAARTSPPGFIPTSTVAKSRSPDPPPAGPGFPGPDCAIPPRERWDEVVSFDLSLQPPGVGPD